MKPRGVNESSRSKLIPWLRHSWASLHLFFLVLQHRLLCVSCVTLAIVPSVPSVPRWQVVQDLDCWHCAHAFASHLHRVYPCGGKVCHQVKMAGSIPGRSGMFACRKHSHAVRMNQPPSFFLHICFLSLSILFSSLHTLLYTPRRIVNPRTCCSEIDRLGS